MDRAGLNSACLRLCPDWVSDAGGGAANAVRVTFHASAEVCDHIDMSLRCWLSRWRGARDRVQKDATDLTIWLGEGAAYREARTRAREHRARHDGAGARHWSRVAVEIARRTGYVIGETVADRYVEAREDAAFAKSKAPSPEIARALAEIAQAIADLTRGRGAPTTLHNVGVWTRRIVEVAGTSPEIARAASDLLAHCRQLAADGDACATALAAGIYPEPAERAGQKLQRLAALAATRAPR